LEGSDDYLGMSRQGLPLFDDSSNDGGGVVVDRGAPARAPVLLRLPSVTDGLGAVGGGPHCICDRKLARPKLRKSQRLPDLTAK
jgi:hypothetical protein